MIYDQILSKYNQGKKQLAVLLDPDKCRVSDQNHLLSQIQTIKPDLLLVGGSLISQSVFEYIQDLKSLIDIPVILYPGNSLHFSSNADALLYLSLISGRNPEFLISHHVATAPLIHESHMEVLSTGYMLIDGGTSTSVQYISQTQPIPRDKPDIAIATALAGQYMGMKLIYMEAGSGAQQPVPSDMIEQVKLKLNIPLMVGGGLNTIEKVKSACQAGADIIVIGNALEKEPQLLHSFADIIQGY